MRLVAPTASHLVEMAPSRITRSALQALLLEYVAARTEPWTPPEHCEIVAFDLCRQARTDERVALFLAAWLWRVSERVPADDPWRREVVTVGEDGTVFPSWVSAEDRQRPTGTYWIISMWTAGLLPHFGMSSTDLTFDYRKSWRRDQIGRSVSTRFLQRPDLVPLALHSPDRLFTELLRYGRASGSELRLTDVFWQHAQWLIGRACAARPKLDGWIELRASSGEALTLLRESRWGPVSVVADLLLQSGSGG